MLQIIFGDDEHTAAEGPYARAMKTRKWLYITCLALLAVTNGYYNPVETQKLIKVVTLNKGPVEVGLLLTSIYLTVQFAFIVAQLVATYDLVLVDRFKSRREEELSRAKEVVLKAVKDYDASIVQFKSNYGEAFSRRIAELNLNLENILSELEKKKEERIAAEWEKGSVDLLRQVRYQEGRLKAVVATTRTAIKKLEANPLDELDPSYDPAVSVNASALKEAEAAFESLRLQEPAERPGYKRLEAIIDAIRIIPPFILASAAIGRSLYYIFGT